MHKKTDLETKHFIQTQGQASSFPDYTNSSDLQELHQITLRSYLIRTNKTKFEIEDGPSSSVSDWNAGYNEAQSWFCCPGGYLPGA